MSSAVRSSAAAGPSRQRAASVGSSSSSEVGGGFGLDDLLPELESPLPAPYSFASYDIPEDVQLPSAVSVRDGRRTVFTRLVGSHPLWAHHLWNTSRVLASYLLRNPSLVKGKRVAELGAGAGLPSIVSALAGAGGVVVTDYPDEELVRNMEYNLDVNLEGDVRGRSVAEGHVWGASVANMLSALPAGITDEANKHGKFDLLYLSDLVFNHSQHAALINSVESLLSSEPTPDPSASDPYPTPSILVFITHHRPHLAHADLAFFPRLASSGRGWAYEQVVEEYAGAMFPDDPGEERVRGTVKGWRCWRVREGEEPGERPSRV